MRKVGMIAAGVCMIAVVSSGFLPARSEDSAHGRHASHGAIEHPQQLPVPVVALEVVPDSMAGWNVHAEVSNFEFTPRSVGGEARPGQGHAHLYVDGVKVARVYGPSFHLGKLEPGTHEIRLTLNADNHAVFTRGGEEIAATTIVRVRKDGSVASAMHGHSPHGAHRD